MQNAGTNYIKQVKLVFVLFVLAFILSLSYDFGLKIRDSLALSIQEVKVGPISKNPIKDILEVSRAYAALFGFEACSFAKSMTGVFYVETGGRQNINNKGPYKGSFQMGIPFVEVSLRYLGKDLKKIGQLAAQGKIPKSTYYAMLKAARQGAALGPNRGRLHHLYATMLNIAQHARMERVLQQTTNNQYERAAAHVIFQFSPPAVGRAIRVKNWRRTFKPYNNCNLKNARNRVSVGFAINKIASGRTSCSSRMYKGISKQNCSTQAGYDIPQGHGSIEDIPEIETPPVSDITPQRDYSIPEDLSEDDPFYNYKDFVVPQDDADLDNSNQGKLPDNTNPDEQNENLEGNEDKEEDNLYEKYLDKAYKFLFGDDKTGEYNTQRIHDVSNKYDYNQKDSEQNYQDKYDDTNNYFDFTQEENYYIDDYDLYDSNYNEDEEFLYQSDYDFEYGYTNQDAGVYYDNNQDYRQTNIKNNTQSDASSIYKPSITRPKPNTSNMLNNTFNNSQNNISYQEEYTKEAESKFSFEEFTDMEDNLDYQIDDTFAFVESLNKQNNTYYDSDYLPGQELANKQKDSIVYANEKQNKMSFWQWLVYVLTFKWVYE